MHKLFSIFSFVLLYVTIAFGQAAVEFQIMVHDNGGSSAPMWFGLDLAATDGLDPALGESDLPPPPPGNAFDTRWWIPPFDGSLSSMRDYRAPGSPPAFPFTGNKQYVIKFQSTSFPITISWDLPSTIATTSTIVSATGGTPVSFSGIGSIVFTSSFIPAALVSIDYIDIVPVELTSFVAYVSEAGVLLNWTTATELNNQGFEIERASSSTTPVQVWEKIGYVPGYGTTTEPKAYSFLDGDVTTGTYNYRLKQIDFDGTIAYSDEIEVVVDLTPDNFELSQNYPNPFNPSTTIQFQVPKASDVTVTVFDMLGQQVKSLFAGQVQAGKYTIEWDGTNNAGSRMSSGSYIYRMTAGEFVEAKEMILLK